MAVLNARIDLPLDEWAPRVARTAVTPILVGWGFTDRGWLEAASVVVSELVTNAVRHGGGCLELTAECRDQRVTITAADGSAVLPERREPDAKGGRGIIIIEMLAERWGVDSHHGGKHVWVRLAPHPARADLGSSPDRPPA
ncbi:ATP-binding protein [Hamadaea sp. NPDC051192]|uniref:ATP-binding protein n=1 Tax=Hamadaea sp. NPDC051192 TaxID=3154940 RepID=UPI00341D2752